LACRSKHLRVYEQRGLVAPVRSAAGWRAYGPDEMERAAEIVALRSLGFSLGQVGRVLDGDPRGLESALAAHQASLEGRLGQLAGMVEKIRRLRKGFAQAESPSVSELARLRVPAASCGVAFDLPWPWGGERFELRELRPLTYITGPLGSGKMRLALRLAEALPNAGFLGLNRMADGGMAGRARLEADSALRSRVDRTLASLVADGATVSTPLVVLLAGLEAEGPAILVVDMIEQGLGQATQEAVIAHLRRRGLGGRPLFLLTRSCAILDLAALGEDEAIILCPANHSPPSYVAPYQGAPGYEAVASCLATPEVRARSEGLIATWS
jgi:DNA-binding transcriptional MerR regulator